MVVAVVAAVAFVWAAVDSAVQVGLGAEQQSHWGVASELVLGDWCFAAAV